MKTKNIFDWKFSFYLLIVSDSGTVARRWQKKRDRTSFLPTIIGFNNENDKYFITQYYYSYSSSVAIGIPVVLLLVRTCQKYINYGPDMITLVRLDKARFLEPGLGKAYERLWPDISDENDFWRGDHEYHHDENKNVGVAAFNLTNHFNGAAASVLHHLLDPDTHSSHDQYQHYRWY